MKLFLGFSNLRRMLKATSAHKYAEINEFAEIVRYYKRMEPHKLTYDDYARLSQLPLKELERSCEVQTFHATGPGGQGVNTADSAVRMIHQPSGVAVVSRESRSQYRNRQLCLQKLRAIFEERAMPPTPRRPTRVSRGQKYRRLEDKHRRSEIKDLRRRVDG